MKLDRYTTEELRAMAKKTDGGRCDWDSFTREMLLAFFRNQEVRRAAMSEAPA